MEWLTRVKQDSRSIEQFNTLYDSCWSSRDPNRIVHHSCKWQPKPQIPNPQQPVLINFYHAAVNPKISTQIVLQGEPNTLDAWITKATEVASVLERTGLLFTRGIDRRHNQAPFKPQIKQEQRDLTTYDGKPTEVNAIEPKGPSSLLAGLMANHRSHDKKGNRLLQSRSSIQRSLGNIFEA